MLERTAVEKVYPLVFFKSYNLLLLIQLATRIHAREVIAAVETEVVNLAIELLATQL